MKKLSPKKNSKFLKYILLKHTGLALITFLIYTSLLSCCGGRGPCCRSGFCNETGIPTKVRQPCVPILYRWDGTIVNPIPNTTSGSGSSSTTSIESITTSLLPPTSLEAILNTALIPDQSGSGQDPSVIQPQSITYKYGEEHHTLNFRLVNAVADNYKSYHILRGQIPTGQSSLCLTQLQVNPHDAEAASPSNDSEPILSVNARIFPGRETTVVVKLSDDFLARTSENVFELSNHLSRETNKGFLSDLIAFDISTLPSEERPLLNNGTIADRVLVSGDFIGLSNGLDNPQNLEIVTPFTYNIGTILTTNKYVMYGPNPSGSLPLESIEAFAGSWRNYNELFRNASQALLVAFPSSEGSRTQHAILISHNLNQQIQKIWVGKIVYTSSSGGRFKAIPVANLVNPRQANQHIHADITNIQQDRGIIKRGKFHVVSSSGEDALSGDMITYQY